MVRKYYTENQLFGCQYEVLFYFCFVLKAFCKYSISKKVISSIDNAFIQDLHRNVFSALDLVDDASIQNLVKRLSKDESILHITDLGAGSKNNTSNSRSVSSIVKHASVSRKFGKLLSTLVDYFECKTIIELGTSLGIGTSYLALKEGRNRVFTIEGCENISNRAQLNLAAFTNVQYFVGDFSTQFASVLNESGPADLVYIDGNHTQKATLEYYEYFLNHVTSKAILIFDDIHWSEGMEKAWQEVVASSEARVTIDLFRMGIVFLDPALPKEHFILKF